MRLCKLIHASRVCQAGSSRWVGSSVCLMPSVRASVEISSLPMLHSWNDQSPDSIIRSNGRPAACSTSEMQLWISGTVKFASWLFYKPGMSIFQDSIDTHQPNLWFHCSNASLGLSRLVIAAIQCIGFYSVVDCVWVLDFSFIFN